MAFSSSHSGKNWIYVFAFLHMQIEKTKTENPARLWGGKESRAAALVRPRRPPEAWKHLSTENTRGRGDKKSNDKQTQVEKATETRWSRVCCRLWACNQVCLKAPSSAQTVNQLPSSSRRVLRRLLLLSGLFRYHGDWRGAAALQASARFVRSRVQVNTFCSRPSVQAQICMRAGRLGWKRPRGREERGEREERRRERRRDERKREAGRTDAGRTETSPLVNIKKYTTFCDQMWCF